MKKKRLAPIDPLCSYQSNNNIYKTMKSYYENQLFKLRFLLLQHPQENIKKYFSLKENAIVVLRTFIALQ